MAEQSMYDNILNLPLFQGLSKNTITQIIEKVKFQFEKLIPGQKIVSQGDVCNKLIYLISGEICCITRGNKFLLTEVERKSMLLEPSSLFGMDTTFQSSYIAYTDACVLIIDKKYILHELGRHEIFRLNYFNLLCNLTQNYKHRMQSSLNDSTENKVISFLCSKVNRLEGEKHIKIRMEDIADAISETRLNVSRVLNKFQEKQCLTLSRKEIHIPEMKDLISLYNN